MNLGEKKIRNGIRLTDSIFGSLSPFPPYQSTPYYKLWVVWQPLWENVLISMSASAQAQVVKVADGRIGF